MFENVINREMEAQRKVVVFYLDLEAHAFGWFCSQGKASLSWGCVVGKICSGSWGRPILDREAPERKLRAWGQPAGSRSEPGSQGDGSSGSPLGCSQQSPFRGRAASLAQHWGAFEHQRGSTPSSPSRTWAVAETCLVVLFGLTERTSGR